MSRSSGKSGQQPIWLKFLRPCRARFMRPPPQGVRWRCRRCGHPDPEPEPYLMGPVLPAALQELERRSGHQLARRHASGNWLTSTCASCVLLNTVEELLEERGAIRPALREAVVQYQRRQLGLRNPCRSAVDA